MKSGEQKRAAKRAARTRQSKAKKKAAGLTVAERRAGKRGWTKFFARGNT